MKKRIWPVLLATSVLYACAPVRTPSEGISPGLTWRVSQLVGGAEAVLVEADGRRSALIRCRDGLLSVDVTTLKPVMGPTPIQASLQLGGAPIVLSTGGKDVMASAAPPADIAQRILIANEFRFTMGNQVFGPYMPPTGAEAQTLANACRNAAMVGSR